MISGDLCPRGVIFFGLWGDLNVPTYPIIILRRVEVSGEGGGGEWRRWWGGGVLEFYPRLSFLIWAAAHENKR